MLGAMGGGPGGPGGAEGGAAGGPPPFVQNMLRDLGQMMNQPAPGGQ